MPPPTPLNIKTSVVARLVKEEASYHKEAVQSQERLDKMVAEEADEYEIRQQTKVVQETIIMPNQVRQKLARAVEDLKAALDGAGERETDETKEKAQKALLDAQKVLDEYAEHDAAAAAKK